MTALIPEKKCPACGFVMSLETVERDPGKIPQAGQFGLCGRCGEILRYDYRLVLCLPTADDMATLQDYQLRLLQAGQKFIKEKP